MSTMKQTLVIAEAGVNHNGDLHLAKKLVDAASDAGADVVKFQTFQASKLATVCSSAGDRSATRFSSASAPCQTAGAVWFSIPCFDIV